MTRLLFGALAGTAATMAMTAAMRQLCAALPAEERYPLPPSELLVRLDPEAPEERHHAETVAGHFGYGALTGAAYGLLGTRMPATAYGVGIWAASYLGWIPAVGLLRPASSHPMRRNLLMIAAHLVWGAALGAGMHELERSERIFRSGAPRDAEQAARKESTA